MKYRTFKCVKEVNSNVSQTNKKIEKYVNYQGIVTGTIPFYARLNLIWWFSRVSIRLYDSTRCRPVVQFVVISLWIFWYLYSILLLNVMVMALLEWLGCYWNFALLLVPFFSLFHWEYFIVYKQFMPSDVTPCAFLSLEEYNLLVTF